MIEDNDILEHFVKDVMDDTPTFSEEMMAKVRDELLKASMEAEKYYKTKAGE